MGDDMKLKINKYRDYIITIAVTLFIIWIGYEYYNKYFDTLKNPLMIKEMIMAYGKYSIFVFFSLQILQVVAFFIPGEIIQIAGGYIYGTLWGSLISMVGITLGSSIVFMLSKRFGKPLVDRIIPTKSIKKFRGIWKSEKVNIIVFIVYLLPGMPKDAMAYICGISNINFRDFITYSTIGRLPGIVISAYFGYNVNLGNWAVLISISIIMVVLFLIGILKGDKIIKKLTKK